MCVHLRLQDGREAAGSTSTRIRRGGSSVDGMKLLLLRKPILTSVDPYRRGHDDHPSCLSGLGFRFRLAANCTLESKSRGRGDNACRRSPRGLLDVAGVWHHQAPCAERFHRVGRLSVGSGIIFHGEPPAAFSRKAEGSPNQAGYGEPLKASTAQWWEQSRKRLVEALVLQLQSANEYQSSEE